MPEEDMKQAIASANKKTSSNNNDEKKVIRGERYTETLGINKEKHIENRDI